MSVGALRSYLKTRNNVLSVGSTNVWSSCLNGLFTRSYSNADDKFANTPEFNCSTIIIENGYNVQELPLVIRKLRDISEIDEKPTTENRASTPNSINYNLIQAEFKQCLDLRDVFSLLSKCTKITPNIALGAMERIYDLEKNPSALSIFDANNNHVNLAKGAILDKLLKVVMKTEETQTIINVLNSFSTFMEPYKYKFCDELLFRVIDNKLSLGQLCDFATFLINNKENPKYAETIDKLWVGFVEREGDINERNIVNLFEILPELKSSKRVVQTLLEQKFSDLWTKIAVLHMQEILSTFIKEKYLSLQSFAVVGSWLYANIHALDEDSLLDVIAKITRLKYTDDQINRAVEKYMTLKGSKVESQILIIGILNYCMQFQIRNEQVLNSCCEFFINKGKNIPHSFLNSFIYPYGFLYFNPARSSEFWPLIEEILLEKYDNMKPDDICSIILSFIYTSNYPMRLISKIFSPEYLVKLNNPSVMKMLYLIDTTLSLECESYSGPLLPKDQWSKPVLQDKRVKNIIDKTKDCFVSVAGGPEKISFGVVIPFLSDNETYLIDIMLHPAGLGSSNFNWKFKSEKNDNTAVLIHLPDHYCSDNEQLIGPQMMRKKHLRLLGMKVASLKYSILSQFYVSHNTADLKEYLIDCINSAEPCT